MLGINIKKLKLFSAKGAQEFVGIDFSGNSLKLAHVRVTPNKSELANISSSNIGGVADNEVSRILSSSFNKLKARNPNIVNIIPSHQVITKNIEVPSSDAGEITQIISLQASRHTPYSREEIIIDHIDIGTYKHHYTKILLVIVARNIVKRQFEILSKAGLKSEKVFLAPESIARCAHSLLKLETEGFPAAIAHIDEAFTDFTIVFKNKPIFIRSIPIGAQHLLNEKERQQVKFIEELRISLEAYQSEDIERTPNLLVLTGAIEETRGLDSVLNDAFHLPTRIIPYFKNLAVSEEVLKSAAQYRCVSFLSVIAPLLAFGEMKINLIPEETKLRQSVEERGKALIKTGIFVLIIFVLVFFILLSKIYFKSVYVNKLDSKLQSLNRSTQELGGDFAKISLIRNYLVKRGYSLEVLTELYSLATLDLELNDIRFDEQGKLSLRGSAESMSAVFSFVDSLEKSKYFKEVKVKYTTKRKEKDKDLTDFEIGALLEKEAQ